MLQEQGVLPAGSESWVASWETHLWDGDHRRSHWRKCYGIENISYTEATLGKQRPNNNVTRDSGAAGRA